RSFGLRTPGENRSTWLANLNSAVLVHVPIGMRYFFVYYGLIPSSRAPTRAGCADGSDRHNRDDRRRLDRTRGDAARTLRVPQPTTPAHFIRPRRQGADADFARGEADYKRRRLERAAAAWLRAASLGHRDAQFRLGECYTRGEGVLCNLADAALWFE